MATRIPPFPELRGMSIRIPPSLNRGEQIRIIPTARAISAEELAEGIALAEQWGLKVTLGSGIGRRHFQQAGTDAERTADLQEAINDPKVRAIWCARGGYGTVRIMDGLDLGPLQKDPKWIVGFSDITVLHNALHNAGLATIHAQMPFMIGNKSNDCKETLRQALFGDTYAVSGQYPGEMERSLARTGECEGQLVGGNLSMLYSLRGTPLDLDPSGKILFLEDLDELRYHADRMIQNLKHGGWFKELAGLVVGGMSDMRDKDPTDPFGMDVETMIAEAVGDARYPVCFGFPAGHIHDNRALVLGPKTKLSVTHDGATLSFGGVTI